MIYTGQLRLTMIEYTSERFSFINNTSVDTEMCCPKGT